MTLRSLIGGRKKNKPGQEQSQESEDSQRRLSHSTSETKEHALPSQEQDHKNYKLTRLDYAKIAWALYDNNEKLKNIKAIKKFTKETLSRTDKLKSEVTKELTALYPVVKQKPHGQKKIEKFITDLSQVIDQLKQLFNPKHKIDVSKAMDQLIMDMSNLFDKFELLNLDSVLIQNIPVSFDDIKQKMLHTLADYLKIYLFHIEDDAKAAYLEFLKQLPPDQLKELLIIKEHVTQNTPLSLEEHMKIWLFQIEGEAGSAYETFWDKITPEQIKGLPRLAQHFVLLGMETALTFYKQFMFTLDKIELQFGFREGALFDVLSQKKVTKIECKEEKSSSKKKPTDYTKIVIEQFSRLTEKYQAVMQITGYQAIELHPYTYSKIEARKKLKTKIKSDLESKKSDYLALPKNLTAEIATILKGRDLTSKFNYSNHLDSIPQSSIKVTIDNTIQIILPEKIESAESAYRIQKELLKQYYLLKKLLKNIALSEEDKDAILVPHKKSLEVISTLEFYLRENERINSIVAASIAPAEDKRPRDFKIQETIKAFMKQCNELANSAKPFFNKNSAERKTIDGISEKLKEVRDQIQSTFDPYFIDYVKQQFELEKQAQKLHSPANKNPGSKKQEEVKKPLDEQKQPTPKYDFYDEEIPEKFKPDHWLENKDSSPPQDQQLLPSIPPLEPDTSFFHFAKKFLISTLRLTDSIDILLAFIEPNKPSSEKSPTEALENDMQQIRFIINHYAQLFNDYCAFEQAMHEKATEAIAKSEHFEMKHDSQENPTEEVNPSTASGKTQNSLSKNFKATLASIKSYSSHLFDSFTLKKNPMPDVEDKKDITEVKAVSTTEHKNAPTGLAADLKYLAYQKFADTLTSIQSCIKELKDQSPKQISFQIGNITFKPHDETNTLLHKIVKDFEGIGLAFVASYSNYLAPPTTFIHIKTSFSHLKEITRLIKNLDKLADIINGNKIAVSNQVLSHLNQLIKQFFIMIDEFEIRFFLMEGIILQIFKKNKLDIESFINKINKALNSRSFEFAPDDCYPYKKAIFENRTKLLDDKNSLVKTIANSRICNTPAIKHKGQLFKNSDWHDLLVKKESELKKAPASENQVTKLELINELLEVEKKHNGSEDFLNDIDHMAIKMQSQSLLKSLICKMPVSFNHNSLINELTLAIDQLKEMRFHWIWSRKKLESRITALEAFRHSLHKDGYTIQDASRELMDPTWKFLLSTDRKLINTLVQIEQKISENKKIKKTILPIRNVSKNMIYEDHTIIVQINERLDVLNNNYKSSNNLKKQALLKTLRTNMLEKKMSFRKALQAAKQKHFKDAYLLYDGKTGKMIRELEIEYINIKKLDARIDRQIYELRKNYYTGFFSPWHIQKASKNIHLLKDIKKNHKKILTKDEEHLLTQMAPDVIRTLAHLNKRKP